MGKEEVFLCNLCDKKFHHRSNIRRHFKSVHQEGKTFSCMLCSKTFTSKYNLERHIKSVHTVPIALKPSDYLKCAQCSYQTIYKYHLKRHTIRQHDKPKKGLSCQKCNKRFLLEKTLKIHEEKAHMPKKASFTRKCPLCNYVSTDKKSADMHCHFERVHDINIKKISLTFDNIDEFNIWKDGLEKSTMSKFNKTISSSTITTFRCHRSGFHKLSCEAKRSSSTFLVNGYCPATINMKCKNDNIIVKYVSNHIGHTNELKRTRLTKDEKKRIALQIANKSSNVDLLQSVRSSLSNHELEQIHLTNREDLEIEKCEQSFNLQDEMIKHPFDSISIMSWVNEIKKSYKMAVLTYKPQGVLDSKHSEFDQDDFLIIFMTEAQNRFLKQNSETIYIDWRHGIDFQLFTLLAIDDTREGFPAAFMICNRSDKVAITTFFTVVKIASGPIAAKVFISDPEETFFSAWQNIMGNPAHRIFYHWNLLKAWGIKIGRKVKSQEIRTKLQKLIQLLIFELNVNTFEQLLHNLLKELDDNATAFKEYFYNHYVKNERYTTWAYCYTSNLGVDTNMFLENFNKILKYFHLKGKHVMPLDKTFSILQLIDNKFFDLLTNLQRDKLIKKMQTLRKNHARSLLIQEQNITRSERAWQVLSSTSTDIYSVVRVRNCNTCRLLCQHCNSCFHEYLCTCIDSCKKNNMCTHIHAVARSSIGHENTSVYESNEVVIMDFVPAESFIDDIFIEISSEITQDNNNTLQDEKLKLLNDLGSIFDEYCDDANVIEYLKAQLKTIRTNVEAIKKSSIN